MAAPPLYTGNPTTPQAQAANRALIGEEDSSDDDTLDSFAALINQAVSKTKAQHQENTEKAEAPKKKAPRKRKAKEVEEEEKEEKKEDRRKITSKQNMAKRREKKAAKRQKKKKEEEVDEPTSSDSEDDAIMEEASEKISYAPITKETLPAAQKMFRDSFDPFNYNESNRMYVK